MEDSDLNCVILRDLHLSSESPISLDNEEAVDELIGDVAAAEAWRIVEERERRRKRQRGYEEKYRVRRQRIEEDGRAEVDRMERACCMKLAQIESIARGFIERGWTSRTLVPTLREECAQAALAYQDTRELARVQKWPDALVKRIQQAIRQMHDFQHRLDNMVL